MPREALLAAVESGGLLRRVQRPPQRRKEAAAKEKLDVLKEERRVANLPKRPVYAEPGSVTLPRFVFLWLDREGDWTVPEIGFLAVVLGMFENRTSKFVNAAFEEESGELAAMAKAIWGSR